MSKSKKLPELNIDMGIQTNIVISGIQLKYLSEE